MTDLLDTASEWLEDMCETHRGRTVTYARGALTAEVTAVLGRTLFSLLDESGFATEYESRDYIIPVSALVAFGDPEAFDTVTDGRVTYEVAAPGGEPSWRYTDGYRRTFRIHCKQLGG